MSGEVRRVSHRGQSFIGMHAMNGNRKGLTMKRRFEEENVAVEEAAKLNTLRPDPAEQLSAYPCLFTDQRVWDTDAEPHWHLGRDRALRMPPRS